VGSGGPGSRRKYQGRQLYRCGSSQRRRHRERAVDGGQHARLDRGCVAVGLRVQLEHESGTRRPASSAAGAARRLGGELGWDPVNKAHLEFCSSPEWARLVEHELLPWVLDGCELGDDLLEVGPGPGLTTDVLRRKAARVTAVELDLGLAAELGSRLAGSNVSVIAGDVTRLPFPAARFSSAACLTMLHHIPSSGLQDAALAEIARVLRPGGLLMGSDGLDTPARREVHHGDVFVPVDPGTLAPRLRAAGFTRACVDVAGDRLKFAAAKGQ